MTNKLFPDTSRVDAAVQALRRFRANLKRRTGAGDGLTSKRLKDLPEDARTILLSSIAFIFRDEVDEWSQINFGNEALDIFFIGLWDLYQKTTGEPATAGARIMIPLS